METVSERQRESLLASVAENWSVGVATAVVVIAGLGVPLAAALLCLGGLGIAVLRRETEALFLIATMATLSEACGALGLGIGVLPVTLSKLAGVGLWLGICALHSERRRAGAFPLAFLGLAGSAVLSAVVMGAGVEYFGAVTSTYLSLTAIGLTIYALRVPLDLGEFLWRFGLCLSFLLVLSMPLGFSGLPSDGIDAAWRIRNSGFSGHPNTWALVVVVLFPVAAVGLARARQYSPAPLVVLNMAVPIVIAQTTSRMGMLLYVLALLAVVGLLRERWRPMLVGILLGVAVLPIVVDVPALLFRYGTLLHPVTEAQIGHGSLGQRATLSSTALAMFLDHPILGVGPGQFIDAAAEYHQRPWRLRPHNAYLGLAAEQGLIGLGAKLLLACAFVVAARACQRVNPRGAASIIGACAVLLACSGGATDGIALFVPFWLVAFIVFAYTNPQSAGG